MYSFVNGSCRSFRGDGKLDLLVRSAETGELFVHPHSGKLNGTLTYEDPVKVGDNFGARRYFFVRACDISGNGRTELCAFSVEKARNPGENGEFGFFYYPNTGAVGEIAPFTEPPVRISGKLDDGRLWETFGFADVLGTGKDDIFSRGENAGNVDIFRHENVGIIKDDTYSRDPLALTTLDVSDFPFAMADFTGNGNLDLLVRRANGDIDLFEFPFKPGLEHADATSGNWYTIARGWQDMKFLTHTDVDLDGKPDLLALRPDGTLAAYVHTGEFDRENPESIFSEPVTVATGFGTYDTVS
ncbi:MULTISPECIES: hypothetical protein [unclassified Streptomyces]|uniref:hypothetical protein n=1 Tax=unclassified Streptomyces TaxID=2593676 RepID=UPI0036E63196